MSLFKPHPPPYDPLAWRQWPFADRARAVLDSLTAGPAAASRPPDDRKGLTTREVEILALISTGLNNQAIAERLFISEHTVHRHVANILTKLDVSSRSAAVAHAGRLGLL